MWQRLRECWLPWLLFCGALFLAFALLSLVVAMPYAIEYLPVNHSLCQMFVDDDVVRRSSIAGAIGLIVTAFVFFRPTMSGRRKPTRTNKDTMAGA